MHWTCCSCGMAVQAEDVGTLLAARWRTVEPTAGGTETLGMLCPVCGQPPPLPNHDEDLKEAANRAVVTSR
jgi:hypothetical protein